MHSWLLRTLNLVSISCQLATRLCQTVVCQNLCVLDDRIIPSFREIPKRTE